jgi:ATP/maltotriose-dependent transcriptional regulator MalT
LQREHLFISSSEADEPVFEYHPMLRGFLLAQARKTLEVATLQALRRESAAVLMKRGETDAAVALHATNSDWSSLAAVIREHAPMLAAHGLHSELGRWLDLIPRAGYGS